MTAPQNTLAIETLLIRSYKHQWLSWRSLNMTANISTLCYRRGNQYRMCNSVSVITAYQDKRMFLGAFLCSPLLSLVYHVPTCYKWGKNILQNVPSNYFLQLSGGYVGEHSTLPRVQGHTAVLERTRLKASLDMFITVWVCVCKHLSFLHLLTFPAASSSEQK